MSFKKLKQVRKEKGFTVTQMVEASGISRSQIYKIESGETKLEIVSNIKALCEFLDVSIYEIMDEEL